MIIYFPNAPKGMDDKIAKANETLKAEAAKAPIKTIAWYKATDAKKKLKAASSGVGRHSNLK